MKRLQGQKNVILMLGSCRKGHNVPSIETPSCETEKVCAALELEGRSVLLLDIRQTCMQAPGKSTSCHRFDSYPQESRLGTIATAINLRVAMDCYHIEFGNVLTFAEIWHKQYSMLKALEPRISELNHFHIDIHLGWFGKPKSQTATRVLTRERSVAFKELSKRLSPVLGFETEAIYTSFAEKLGLLEWNAEPEYGNVRGMTVEDLAFVEDVLDLANGTVPLIKNEITEEMNGVDRSIPAPSIPAPSIPSAIEGETALERLRRFQAESSVIRRTCTTWSTEEIEVLLTEFAAGKTCEEIAQRLPGRTGDTCRGAWARYATAAHYTQREQALAANGNTQKRKAGEPLRRLRKKKYFRPE